MAKHDIFAALERLADLRQKNILTEEEFAAKKAELLSRLCGTSVRAPPRSGAGPRAR